MKLNKIVFVIYLLQLFIVSNVFADPPENELNQYLTEIGWTKQEFLEYLDFYEIPLEDFHSIDELKWVIGTPITSQNLRELLAAYNITENELHQLLEHFGDSFYEYKFIEDLQSAVEFYINHDEYMAEIESDLAQIGITEKEVEKFFEYLSEVEEKNQHQLDQTEWLDSRLEKFTTISDSTELSDEEIDELVQILQESINLYEIEVKFKTDHKDVTLKELLKMKDIPNDLLIEVYNLSGELLIDFTLPTWLFETGEIIDEGEDLIHLGELSDEFIDYLHEEKYENARRGNK